MVVIIIKITETATTNNREVLGNLHHHTQFTLGGVEVFNFQNFIPNIFVFTWRYWEVAALGNWPLTGKFTSEV